MDVHQLPPPGVPERFKHFFIGENKMFFPDEEFILHLGFPRCFIRYDLAEGMTTDFDAFIARIAEVQWIDGHAVSESDKARVLRDAWNFLALDERLLEDDLDALDEDDLDALDDE